MKQFFYVGLLPCLIFCSCLTTQAKNGPTNLTVSWDSQHGSQLVNGDTPGNKVAVPCDPYRTTLRIYLSFATGMTACQGGKLPQTGMDLSTYIVPPGGCDGVFEFIVELSDATGDFSNATVMGETLTDAFDVIRNFTFPTSLPSGANYQIRLRFKNTTATSNSVGPLVLGSPDSQITNLVTDQTGCPVKIQAQLQGNSLVLTGPNGYIFSYAYRQPGPNTVLFTVPSTGTYTLSSYPSIKNAACPSKTPYSARQTLQISRNCP